VNSGDSGFHAETAKDDGILRQWDSQILKSHHEGKVFMKRRAGPFALCLTGIFLFAFTGISWAGKALPMPSDEARTIPLAMIKADAGDTILVENGVYKGHFFIEPGVIFKARNQFGAILDGDGSGTAITLGRKSELWGFVVRNGTVGVFSKGKGNIIRGCRIVQNWQTGIVCVSYLPIIEDNYIVFNGASGIQGWDLRCPEGVSINHNCIAYNANHGIAFGGKSEATVAQNIIAFNERFGIKIRSPEEPVRIAGNNFFGNLWSPTPAPEGNFAYDPGFISSRSMEFSVASKCKECPEDQTPGVRELEKSLFETHGTYGKKRKAFEAIQ
jgi:hypothetical protein